MAKPKAKAKADVVLDDWGTSSLIWRVAIIDHNDGPMGEVITSHLDHDYKAYLEEECPIVTVMTGAASAQTQEEWEYDIIAAAIEYWTSL